MKTNEIMLNALHTKRNLLLTEMHYNKTQTLRYEKKLAPQTIFGHALRSLTKTTCEYYIKQINIYNSELKLIEFNINELNTIIASMPKKTYCSHDIEELKPGPKKSFLRTCLTCGNKTVIIKKNDTHAACPLCDTVHLLAWIPKIHSIAKEA